MSLSDISSKFTTSTLDEIIQKAGGTRHTSFKFGKGFKKGDHYLSKVFRLSVFGINDGNGSTLELNLIIKAMPENLARRKLFRSVVFFRNEINFYTKVVPAWEDFQADRQPEHPFTEYPSCYATYCDGENDFIALEDVNVLGFGSPNRQDYVTLEETLLTLRTLGRFHGLALAFKELEPQKFEEASKALEETYYTEELRAWYIGFMQLACNVGKDAVSHTYPQSNYEAIALKFLNPDKLYDEMIKMVSTRSQFSVFGHGDCWTLNFLTKYNKKGAPEAIKLIDFQLARFASFALDISFYIYSCTSQELREQSFEQLLKEYHTGACSIITDLGADASIVLPWEGLQAEMQEFARFGCGMGIESVPMSMIEDDEVADLDAIKEDSVLTDIWNIKPFKDAAKQERIAQIFKHAIDEGYLK